jgi:dipeptide/tripeptide permease
MSKEISGKDRTQSNGDEDDTTQPPPPTAHSERSPLLINNKTSRTGSSNPSIPFYSASNGTSGHHKRAVSSSFGNTTGATSPSGLTNQDQYLYVNQLLTVINDRRTRFQQNFSLVILLLVNVLERFAYYGLICNYLLYLNKEPFFWESFNASLLLFVFIGVTNLSGLVGGWVADSYIGKYTTICISFIVYIIGYAAYPLLSISETALPGVCSANGSVVDWSLINVTAARLHRFDPLSKDSDKSIFAESCSWLIIITIFLIGIGVGFVKANLGPFGADQVLSRGQPMVFKYFNWLYWSINLGSLASFSLLAYLQQNVNFLIGYLIPFVALVLSFLLFLIGIFRNQINKKLIEILFTKL